MPALQAAERDYDLNRAAELKYGTLLELQKGLLQAEQMLGQAESVSGPRSAVRGVRSTWAGPSAAACPHMPQVATHACTC